MLGKLIKYDLKALAKILAPLWGVLLVMGIIFGISIRSNLEGIGNTMIVFRLFVIVAVIVAVLERIASRRRIFNVYIASYNKKPDLIESDQCIDHQLWNCFCDLFIRGRDHSDQSSKTYGYRNVFWKLGHRSTRRTMDRIWSNHSGGKSAKQYLSCIRSNGDRTAEQRQSIPVCICSICSIINHCITYWNSNNGKFRKYGFKPAERIWI